MAETHTTRDPGVPAVRIAGAVPPGVPAVAPLQVHQDGDGPALELSRDTAGPVIVVKGGAGISVRDALGIERASIAADGTISQQGASLNSTYAPQVRVSSTIPMMRTAQIGSGAGIAAVFSAGQVLIRSNTFGIAMSADAGANWTSKTLPSGVPTSAASHGPAKGVLFKGNWYFQFKDNSGIPGIYSAAPIAIGGTLSWSTALKTGPSGATTIQTGFNTDGTYLYWCDYGDPVGGPSVYRSADGTTWETVLGPGTFAARHVHGVFPDPYNPGHVYVTCGDAGSAGFVYRSTNYGAAGSWTSVSTIGTAQPWQCVQLSFSATHIYAASDSTTSLAAWRMARGDMVPQWIGQASQRLMAVPGGLPARRVTDLSTTSGSSTVTSATAAFTSADVGSIIRTSGQDNVPIGTYIASVTNSTTAVLSNAAKLTATNYTAIFGAEAFGAMSYYGAVDPATGIYYYASINGAAGGNVDGLFAILPSGQTLLLDILTTSPDGQMWIVPETGTLWAVQFSRPLLTI